jgi:hypothetical protein
VKLEGSLDAFSLPDVFQLLSLTKKSGGLHLANGQSSGVVYFQAGAVTGACSDASRQSLARRLVGLAACDDAALRRAVERAVSEEVGVARALAEAGAVDADLLNRLAMEQTIDAVFDLLRWPEGDFAFGVDETNPDEVGLSVAADQVVAEAATRRETWEAVSRVIPSPDVVLTMPVVVPEDPAISRDEWALLALIDGHRTVGQLVEVSGAGQFSVVSALATLVQRGMLVLQDEEAPDHITLVLRRQQLLAPLEIGLPVEVAAPPVAEPQPVAQPVPQPGLPPAPAVPSAPPSPPLQYPDPRPVMAPAAPEAAPAQPSAPLAPAAAATDDPVLGGAHDPVNVVPPRPEPFMPKRVVEHPEPTGSGFGPPPPTMPSAVAGSAGGPAAAVQPMGESAIERDPTVNRSLMLRLIAGVRGL